MFALLRQLIECVRSRNDWRVQDRERMALLAQSKPWEPCQYDFDLVILEAEQAIREA